VTEPERVELEYTLSLAERRALLRRTYWLVRPSRWPRVGLAVLLGLAMSVVSATIHPLALAVWWPVALLAVLLGTPELRVRRAAKAQAATQKDASTRLVLDRDGLLAGTASEPGTTRVRWRASTSVVRWRHFTLLHLDRVHAIGVPDRAFANAAERERVIAWLRGALAEAHAPAEPQAPPPGFDERVYERLLTLQDHIDLMRWSWLRGAKRRAAVYLGAAMIGFAFGGVAAFAALNGDAGVAAAMFTASTALLLLASLPVWYPLRLPALVRQFAARQPDLYPTGLTRFGLGPKGVHLASEHGESTLPRAAIVGLHGTETGLYLELTGSRFAILPDHATVPESWGLQAPVGRGQAQATGNPFEAPR